MTLTEFLLARIAEDEARADRLPLHHPEGPPSGRPYWIDTMGHPVYEPRSRALAECEAKRRIVERHKLGSWHSYALDADVRTCEHCNTPDEEWPCPDLRDLALPYADHPDYREEWRP